MILLRKTWKLSYLLLVTMWIACSGTKETALKSPILYKTDFEVKHRVVHTSTDSASLQVLVGSSTYELSFRAYAAQNKDIILAEDQLTIQGRMEEAVDLPFKIRDARYVMEVFIRDLEDGRVFRNRFAVDRSLAKSQIQINDENGNAALLPYHPIGTKVQLSQSNGNTIWVKYFERDFKAASAPFSDKGRKFNPRRGIGETVKVPNGGTISLDGEGLYFVQTDTALLDGVFLNVFEGKYPRISSAQDMAESIRYITKSDEYKSLVASSNTKDDVEQFWLDKAKNKQKAKELIKAYYTRVQVANRDFTTYKEGWKTDRGMIFLIFGRPKQVRKNPEGEEWIYAASGRRNGIQFRFKLIDGQSLLSRSSFFKKPWDVEVYEWRKGILN